MYAHQVIEDLDKYKNFIPKPQIMVITGAIKSAQHFFLGDIDDDLEIGKPFLGRQLFLEKGLSDGVRMPYSVCWFDYTCKREDPEIIGTVLKSGLLVLEITHSILLVYVFDFFKYLNLWTPAPIVFFISIGSLFDENKTYPCLLEFLSKGTRPEDIMKTFEGRNIQALPLYNKNISDKFADKDLLKWAMEHRGDLTLLNTAVMLLGCKNIITEKIYPDAKLQKARVKKGKQPLFTYHTLIIKPTGKHQESVPKHLWGNRIHLCRGHFKTYTKENPLFGSITGRFWWQPSVRGQSKNGVVMKDYRVECAQNALT